MNKFMVDLASREGWIAFREMIHYPAGAVLDFIDYDAGVLTVKMQEKDVELISILGKSVYYLPEIKEVKCLSYK